MYGNLLRRAQTISIAYARKPASRFSPHAARRLVFFGPSRRG